MSCVRGSLGFDLEWNDNDIAFLEDDVVFNHFTKMPAFDVMLIIIFK